MLMDGCTDAWRHGQTDDRQKVITIAHPEHSSAELKIFQRVLDLQNRHKINALSLSNKTKADNCKSKKGRVVILVHYTSSSPVFHIYQVPSKYFKGYSSYLADTKSFSNKTKGNNSKSKKARVFILARNTLSVRRDNKINALSLSNITRGEN